MRTRMGSADGALARRLRTVGGLALASVLALTACGGGDTTGGATTTGSGESSAGSTEGGAVGNGEEVVFWSGHEAAGDIVAQWNEDNPDIPVRWENSAGSTDDQAASLIAAVQAGEGPCISYFESARGPSLAANGVLMDVEDHVAQYRDDYFEGVWDTVSFGGRAYGLPADIGPMALFYRADKFEELGLEVPTTWEEFRAAAETVAEQAPGTYLTGLGSDNGNEMVSLIAQTAPAWFSIEGDAWKVDIDSAESREITDYWQGLMDDGLLNTTNRWDPTFYNDLAEGKQISVLGGAWNAGLIKDNVGGTSGNWRVAPIPTWDGQPATAGNGGSSMYIAEGCGNVEGAVAFSHWYTTTVDNAVKLDIFPAVAGEEVPTSDELTEFYGGQEINTEFGTYAESMRSGWLWSPAWNETQPVLSDGTADFVSGSGKLGDVLTDLQQAQVDALKRTGISVVE